VNVKTKIDLNRKICFFDTETCGFHGPIVLIQYAIEPDYEIILHNVWYTPVYETLSVLLKIIECKVVCYNLSFDWFHINKLYNMLRLVENKSIIPIDHIDLMIEIEKRGRDGKCVKPFNCLDLMLHARKGPYQSAMGIKPVVIRRVPDVTAVQLRDELEKRIDVDPIYLGEYSRRDHEWVIIPCKENYGFSDLLLKLKPSLGLKAMSEFVLGRKRDSYTDVNPPASPVELGYAPYACAIIEMTKWPTSKAPPLFGRKYNGAWPLVIEEHAAHWGYIPAAREYARLDVQDTMDLYFKFDRPDFDDDDSVLAAMVGAVRYKGFAYDRDLVTKTRDIFEKLIDNSIPYTNSKPCLKYLGEAMTDEQFLLWDGKTKGKQLEAMIEWEGKISEVARKIYWSRKWAYLVTLFNKILVSDRMHPDFNVIGAKSTRMSGRGGLNFQGIPKIEQARECFNFAFEGEQLSGGDFKAFEVVIFLATAGPGKLLDAVISGQKIHALYGQHLYPEMSYDEIMATDGTEDDKYTRSKSGFFLNMFGGTEYALNRELGIPMERGKAGIASFSIDYPEVGRAQAEATKPYIALTQDNGPIEWTDPKNFIESLLGFKRFFDMEIDIMKNLYEIATERPEEWSTNQVFRKKDGAPQTAAGATCSALYGAAFSLQSRICRIAGNHRIQSTGAGILKRTQCEVWALQPCGIKDWSIRTANIHDELLTVSVPKLADQIKRIVEATVIELREVVPLLDIKWAKGTSWAEVH